MWTVPVPLKPPPKFPNFARRLQSARILNFLSKYDMTAKLGVTMKQYQLWEYGYELPDDDTLRKLNRILFTKLED